MAKAKWKRKEYLWVLKQLIRTHKITLSEADYKDDVLTIRVEYNGTTVTMRSFFNLVHDALGILYWVGKPVLLGVLKGKGTMQVACTKTDNPALIEVSYKDIPAEYIEELNRHLVGYLVSGSKRTLDKVTEHKYLLPCTMHESLWVRTHKSALIKGLDLGYVMALGDNEEKVKAVRRWGLLAHPLCNALAGVLKEHPSLYRFSVREMVDKNAPNDWYVVAVGIVPAHPELHDDVTKSQRALAIRGVIPDEWTVDDVVRERKEQLHIAFLILYHLRNYVDAATYGFGNHAGRLYATGGWYEKHDKWCERNKGAVWWVNDEVFTPFLREWKSKQQKAHRGLEEHFKLFAHKTRITASTGYTPDGRFESYSLTAILRDQVKLKALLEDLLSLNSLLLRHAQVFPFRVYEDLRTWAVEVDLLPKDNDVVFGLTAHIIKVENGVSKHAGDTMYSNPEEVQYLYKKSFARLCYAMYLIAKKHGYTLQFGEDLDRSVYDAEVVKCSRNVKEIINLMMIGAI